MFEEFKKFAVKGNIIDLAVGVIIGGAFGKIVSSLVADIITPLLGMLTGKINIAKLQWTVNSDLTIKYGQFLQSMIDFLIISLSIFIIIKALNSFKKKEDEKPLMVKPSKEELLLTEIRDILKELENKS